MHFTFDEWNLIRQAVRNWKENSEDILKECKPSNERTSVYQIYKNQVIQLTALEDKIRNSVI